MPTPHNTENRVTITFQTRFNIEFDCKISDVKKIDELLKENGIENSQWHRVPFENWVKFKVPVTICKAYALKQLLKNFKYIHI